MPKQIKYSKELIVSTGLDLLRKEGIESISARNIAKSLHCSIQPIFSYFVNMDEYKKELRNRANEIYSKYIQEALKDELPFKASGIKFIQFAKDEPQLFKFLFLQKCDDGVVNLRYLPKTDTNSTDILSVVRKEYGLNEVDAKNLYNHLTIYSFGIASLIVNKAINFEAEEIDKLLSELFLSLIKKYKSNK